MRGVAIFAILIPSFILGIEPENPRVTVEQGTLEGTYMTSQQGRRFKAFLGIPFARPPVGKYRFKDPHPPIPWDGVWKANTHSGLCIQYNEVATPGEDKLQGTEDCLYLNVFTPLENRKDSPMLYDVFVYIHGGAFMFGGAAFNLPNVLMDRDVILVSINYRLNIFGFLSTEDSVIQGNYGLKDQTAAIKWVKNNIAAFGGNPTSITLTGLSAGGASVHYHYLSPLSKGLFKGGISTSGTSTCEWALTENSRIKAEKLAQLLGCPTKTSKEMLRCLRYRPARALVDQIKNFQPWIFNPFSPFGPVVEKSAINPFLNITPIEALRSGKIENVPWLTSLTTEEGLYPIAHFLGDDQHMKDLDAKFLEIAPHFLDYNFTVPTDLQKEVSAKIRKFYLGEAPISEENIKELIKMGSDRFFVIEGERSARLQSAKNSAPVYFYEFSYRGQGSLSELMSHSKHDWGVSHGDDFFYVLPLTVSNTKLPVEDQKITQHLIDIWVSFAKNGIPSVGQDTVKWTPVTPSKVNYLKIKGPNDFEAAEADDMGNRAFWDSLPITEQHTGILPSEHVPDEL